MAMERIPLMTYAQRARRRRDLRLREQFEELLRQYPGSTTQQVLLEMAHRGCGGLHSAAGVRRALIGIGALAPRNRRNAAPEAEGGAE